MSKKLYVIPWVSYDTYEKKLEYGTFYQEFTDAEFQNFKENHDLGFNGRYIIKHIFAKITSFEHYDLKNMSFMNHKYVPEDKVKKVKPKRKKIEPYMSLDELFDLI